jgi:amino acid adenylation domain-containing protein/thioester reductase-like protein
LEKGFWTNVANFQRLLCRFITYRKNQMLENEHRLTVHQLIEYQAAQTPDLVAVIFGERQLTYQELNQKANQLAHYLTKLGVKPEVLVGVCIERSLEMIIALLGILKAGGAYVPLDPTYPAERLGFIVEDTLLSVLITQQSLLRLLPTHQAQIVNINCAWANLDQESRENPAGEVKPENLSYVIYTSGSTGRPKGVAIEHRNCVEFIEWSREFFTPDQIRGVLASTSICFDLSIFEIFATLSCGGMVILAQDAMELPKLPAVNKVTLINTVPSAISTLLRINAIPQSVNTINLAGEPLQNTLVQKLYQINDVKHIYNLYGPTEDTTYSTVALMEKGMKDIPCIGKPINNTQVYILDTQLKNVQDGEEGEIYISGSGLARGYLNRPELTSEKFIPNPFSNEPGSRLYRTGDLGVWLPDGNIKCLGRIDHQVKIRGFRIELGEVESVLGDHPNIKDVITVASDEDGEKRLIAYVVSNINPDRLPYSTDCLVELENKTIKLQVDDISSGGIGLIGVSSELAPGKEVRLSVCLPNEDRMRFINGKVLWRQHKRVGIQFCLTPFEQDDLEKVLNSWLESEGFLKMWRRTLSRLLRQYLVARLPEYMIPSAFVYIDRLPLTSNGKVDRKALPAPQWKAQEDDVYIAPQNPIEEKIAEAWCKILRIEQIGIHDSFNELGGHSLQAIQLVAHLQELFKLEIPLERFLESPTIFELANTIKALSEEATNQHISEKLDEDFELDSTIFPLGIRTENIPQIFITGVSGTLGRALLYELLNNTRGDIYCLIRAKNIEEGRARIQIALSEYFDWKDSYNLRIIPIIGDLGKPYLGLTNDQFTRLSEKIDTIYHSGANVNMVYPYNALKEVNVFGTQEVLRLASLHKLKPVHFISTVDVYPILSCQNVRTINEDDPIGARSQLISGYAQTKYIAEKLINTAYSRGIPTTIYRPSNIMGHSETGNCPTNVFVAKMLKGCIQMKMAPNLEVFLNIVPVNYISKAIIYMSSLESSIGQAFNMVNIEAMEWNQLIHWMNEWGYPAKLVPYDVWYMELLKVAANEEDNILVPLISIFKNQEYIRLLLGAFKYSYTKGHSILLENSINCSPTDQNLLRMYFSHFIKTGYLPDITASES